MKDMNDSSKYNIEKGILPFNSGNPINFLNFKKNNYEKYPKNFALYDNRFFIWTNQLF